MAVLAAALGNRLPEGEFSVQKPGKGIAFRPGLVITAVRAVNPAACVGLAIPGFIAVCLPDFKAIALHASAVRGFLNGRRARLFCRRDFEIGPNRFRGYIGPARRRRQCLIVFVQVKQPEKAGGAVRLRRLPGGRKGQFLPGGSGGGFGGQRIAALGQCNASLGSKRIVLQHTVGIREGQGIASGCLTHGVNRGRGSAAAGKAGDHAVDCQFSAENAVFGPDGTEGVIFPVAVPDAAGKLVNEAGVCAGVGSGAASHTCDDLPDHDLGSRLPFHALYRR